MYIAENPQIITESQQSSIIIPKTKDEVQDINACARIGIRIISVSWGNDSAEALKEYNPDYLCNTTEDLFKYLVSD